MFMCYVYKHILTYKWLDSECFFQNFLQSDLMLNVDSYILPDGH